MQYKISGKVVKGNGYGKKLGFPTVNLEITEGNSMQIVSGVYAGVAFMDGVVYRSGIVVDPNDKIEAHLIGYEGDAYGKVVVLTTHKFLRDFKKFDMEEELVNQIKEDIKLCQ